MKTNTPLNSQTQAHIRQLKLGVDWHADHFRLVRMCDGQSPQSAGRLCEKADGGKVAIIRL